MGEMQIWHGKGNGCGAVLGRLEEMPALPPRATPQRSLQEALPCVERSLLSDKALAEQTQAPHAADGFCAQLALLRAPRFRKELKRICPSPCDTVDGIRRLLLKRESPQKLQALCGMETLRREDLQELFYRLCRALSSAEDDAWFRDAVICVCQSVRAESILRWYHGGALGVVCLEALPKDSRAAALASALHFPMLDGVQKTPLPENASQTQRAILDATQGSLILSPDRKYLAEFSAMRLPLSNPKSKKEEKKTTLRYWHTEDRIAADASHEWDGYLYTTPLPKEEADLTDLLFSLAERQERGKTLLRIAPDDATLPFWRAVSLASVSGAFCCAVSAATAAEMRRCHQQLKHCREELEKEKREFSQKVTLGAWIETPQAALTVQDFLPDAAFLWIDGDALLDRLAAHRDAFLHLLRLVLSHANRRGCPVGLLGKDIQPILTEEDMIAMGVDAVAFGTP